ncbi:MAG: peptidoglycan-binding domain-containing protein, partial [Actinomycetota bacterium]
MTLITDPERNDATNNADPTAGAATVRTPTNGDTRDDTRLAEPPSPPTNSAESASNRSGRRRRWPYVAAGLGLAAAGTASAVVLTGDGDEADVAEPMSFRTVSAEVRDLVEFTELDGRMVYADTVALTAATDGVVTEVVADGDSVERGQTVYEINGLPVVAFVGDTPMYRTLGPGATGDDVRLIEANLASLGHHTVEDDDGDPVDTGFVVDDVWDDATTDAVVRWQEDLGVATTGQIAATDLIVIDGSAPVIDVPIEVGERVSAGTPLVELSGGPITSTRHVEHSGEIELAVVAGAPIANGDIVYTVDGAPVTAIVAPDGLERELSEGVEPGEDVMALEEMLLALGHDADGDLDVDDEFDEATTRAVIEWQEDLQDRYEDDDVDVRVDGRVEPSEMYVVDEGEVVGTITAHDDELLASGTEIWSADTSG